MDTTIRRHKVYVLLISLVSAMGGLLFGYDWVVAGGAKPFYEAYFGIEDMPAVQGWVMGCAILGCLAGVTAAGSLADRYGRKPLMVAAAVIFVGAADSLDGTTCWSGEATRRPLYRTHHLLQPHRPICDGATSPLLATVPSQRRRRRQAMSWL